MFRQQDNGENHQVSITLDGRQLTVPSGVSVAAALLSVGEIVSRLSPSSGKKCSPHCLMGVCFECLMEINGVQRQACMIEVQEGLVIKRRDFGNGKGVEHG